MSEKSNAEESTLVHQNSEEALRIIKEWLAEYKTLSDSQLSTFGELQRSNTELLTALQLLFVSLSTDAIIEPVCHQLFDFYRSPESALRRFSLELLPNLILYSLQAHDSVDKGGAAVEACLLGIYNLEIVHTDGESKVTSFRIPSLALPSIYHEPVRISSLALTETALSKFANKDTEVWTRGPFQQHDVINIQNRDSVLTLLLQSYNGDIVNLSHWSREAFCLSCLRIAGAGFKQFSSQIAAALSGPPHHERISVTPGLLVEQLSGIYFCLYNGHTKAATLALEAIHARACFDLYADVLLVTNAIRNSLQHSTDGSDTMGIAVSVMTSSTHVCKTALTNASFRAHKLPGAELCNLADSVYRLTLFRCVQGIIIKAMQDDISIPQTKSLPAIEEKIVEPAVPASKLGVASIKGKLGKTAGRRVDKGRLSLGNMNFNNPDFTDSMSVVVAKKYTKTTVDNIELSNLNTVTPKTYLSSNPNLNTNVTNIDLDASSTDADVTTAITQSPDGAENGETGKPRSSSLTSSTPIVRHITSRYSSHSINPSSTQTLI